MGSVDLAGWYMRMIHYVLNWLFIILTTIHVYLSVTEDFPAFLNFFGLGGVEEAVRRRRTRSTEPRMKADTATITGGQRQAPAAPEPAL